MSESQTFEQNSQLAKIEKPPSGPDRTNERMQAIAALSNNGKNAVAHNFDTSDEVGQMQLMGVQLTEPKSIWKEAVTDAEITQVIVSQFETVDRESGEVVDKLRTLFVTKNGEVLSSNSPACARFALQLLQSPLGKGAIDPPLAVKFRRLPTLDGGTCLTCSVEPNEFLKRANNLGKVSKKK